MSLCAAAPLTLTVTGTGHAYGFSQINYKDTAEFSMVVSYDSEAFHDITESRVFGPVSLKFATSSASYALTSNGAADIGISDYNGDRVSFEASFDGLEEWGHQEAGLYLKLKNAGDLTVLDLLKPNSVALADLAAASFILQTKDNGGYVIGDQIMFFDSLNIAVAAPVPEPEAYAMLLGGLAFVGAVAARRRRYS